MTETDRKGWFARLKQGLAKSSTRLSEGVTGIFTRRKLDEETLDELEELLISADLGVAAAGRIRDALAKNRVGKEVTDAEIKTLLAEQIEQILAPCARPLAIDGARKPHVILVVGVNGNGKTTSVGKMAHLLKSKGHSVQLAACDTFRAAAVEQLAVWGERAGVPVTRAETGADAAALAYKAYERARAEGVDVLLIDTAGRLHTKANLMAELEKIIRVLKKLDEHIRMDTLMVLDATTGQNAHSQLATFRDQVAVSGLVVTKLDGTAKGGVVVALAETFKLPIHAVGVGEGIDDLREFSARDFAHGLVGMPTSSMPAIPTVA